MSKIIFNYHGQDTTILCKSDEKLKKIIKKFSEKIQVNMNKIYVIYNGKIVDEELKFNEIAKKEDQERKIMNVLVEEIEEFKDISNENIIKAKNIICPKCKENILIEFNDYNINLFSCKNGHELNNLSIKDFESTQYINMAHIICDICKDKNKANTFNNEFHYCLTCKIQLCPLCKTIHDTAHIITEFENKDNLCEIHKEVFTKFCKQCKRNICMKCENEHKNHCSVYFGDLLANEDKIKELSEFKNYLDKFNNDIKNMIQMLQNVMDNINTYFNICSNYIENNSNIRNYHILTNINEFLENNKKFYIGIKSILIEQNNENKFKSLMDIYHKINPNTINNKIEINPENSNYIVGELEISSNSLIKIINSFEHYKKEKNKTYIANEENYYNEDEIKNNCIIKINGKVISFSYYYRFIKNGKNKVEFIFTKKLKNINHIFAGCSFKYIDLSKLNVSNIVNMNYLFLDCKNLTNVNLSCLNLNNLTEASGIFSGCSSLMNINLSNSNLGNLTNMKGMFSYLYVLKSIDFSNCKVLNVTNMENMFYGCGSLTSINVSSFVTSNVTNMSGMFGHSEKITSLNLSNFNTSKVTNMSDMFNGCFELTSLNISSFNTSNVIDMRQMFSNCQKLTTLNLSTFNTSKVTDMGHMFSGCFELTSLNISSFNTSNVTDMSYMFMGCSSLTSLNLNNFTTSKVTNMFAMFHSCDSLTSLNLSSFNTSKVTDMSLMFAFSSKLTSLNVSSFNTSNVTTMEMMFNDLNKITTLDISSFNTSKVTNMTQMFDGCSLLRTIYAGSNWSTTKVTSSGNMFKDCTRLRGDRAYNASYVDKTYAKTSGGYLTLKN